MESLREQLSSPAHQYGIVRLFSDEMDYDTGGRIYTALLQKLNEGRSTPNPRRIYATRTVSGVPSCVNPFRIAARTCNSAT